MLLRIFSSSFLVLFLLCSNNKTENHISGSLTPDLLFADTMYVIVNDVAYDDHDWKFWGFENDWMQEQVVNRLKKDYKKKKVSFSSKEEAIARDIKAGRIIEISFNDIKIGQLKNRRSSRNVTRRVVTGYTNSTPMERIYGNVSATIFTDENSVNTTGRFTCHIYIPDKDSTILLYKVPVSYNWINRSYTFSGDDRAISSNLVELANKNGNGLPPPDNELVQKLVKNSYEMLMEEIGKKVKF